MRERTRIVVIVHEVERDKEIVVVTPTADLNRKYSMSPGRIFSNDDMHIEGDIYIFKSVSHQVG
jgi:hypothetical protein